MIAHDAAGATGNLNRSIAFQVEAMEAVVIFTVDTVRLEAMEASTLIAEGDLVACILRTMKSAMGTAMDAIDRGLLLRTDTQGTATTTDLLPKTGPAPRWRHPVVAVVE